METGVATKTKYFKPAGKLQPASAAPAKEKPRPKQIAAAKRPAVKATGPTTKAKIERAALALFSRGGVDGVSTKDLAATAGVSEGVIYRYFKSKDELARSLMVAGHKRLADMVRDAQAGSGRLSEKVATIVAGYCAFADEDWDAFSYYVLHFHRFKDLAADAGDSPMGAAIEIISRAQSRGEIPHGDPSVKAAMALGCVLQTATSKIYGQIAGSLSDHKAAFNAAVMAVLLSNAD